MTQTELLDSMSRRIHDLIGDCRSERRQRMDAEKRVFCLEGVLAHIVGLAEKTDLADACKIAKIRMVCLDHAIDTQEGR